MDMMEKGEWKQVQRVLAQLMTQVRGSDGARSIWILHVF